MPFTIQATNAGVVSFTRETLDDAVDKAMELQGSGYTTVTILDASGQAIEETELERLFNERN